MRYAEKPSTPETEAWANRVLEALPPPMRSIEGLAAEVARWLDDPGY